MTQGSAAAASGCGAGAIHSACQPPPSALDQRHGRHLPVDLQLQQRAPGC